MPAAPARSRTRTVRVMFTGLPKPVSASAKHRDRNGVADRRDMFRRFAQCDEADIGNAKRHVGDAGAGDVDASKPRSSITRANSAFGVPGRIAALLAREQCLQPRGMTFEV